MVGSRLRALMSSKGDPTILGGMDSRTNHIAAMVIDLAVILLPEVGMHEAASMLRRHLIPFPIAFRTLATRRHRRIAFCFNDQALS